MAAKTHEITLHLSEISSCVWQKTKPWGGGGGSLWRLTREALIKSCGQKDWEGGGYEDSKGRERAWDPGVRSGSLSRLQPTWQPDLLILFNRQKQWRQAHSSKGVGGACVCTHTPRQERSWKTSRLTFKQKSIFYSTKRFPLNKYHPLYQTDWAL